VHLQLVNSLFHVVVPLQVCLLVTYVSLIQRGGLYIDPAVDGILGVYPRGELEVWNLISTQSCSESVSLLVFLASASSRIVVSAF
jgi:hypothetical protein